MDNRAIGMFDSGCGGLTVLKQYTKLMPNENFIYYGDTAHLPYGDKSPEKIIEYCDEIVNFLINKDVKIRNMNNVFSFFFIGYLSPSNLFFT